MLEDNYWTTNILKGSFDFTFVLSSYYCKQVPKWDNLVVCPQTFIVRNLSISHTQKHHIYLYPNERRGNRLGARETERECVCEWWRVAEKKLASVVKMAVGEWLLF